MKRTGARRSLASMVLLLTAVIIALYAGDWAVLRARRSRGTAFGGVTVHQFLVTPLKGQKDRFDYLGDVPVVCSRSIFPQAGNSPCWWVERHTTVWQ